MSGKAKKIAGGICYALAVTGAATAIGAGMPNKAVVAGVLIALIAVAAKAVIEKTAGK